MLKIEDIKPGVRLKAIGSAIRQVKEAIDFPDTGEGYFTVVSVERNRTREDHSYIRGYFDSDIRKNVRSFFFRPDRFDFDLGIIPDKIPNQLGKSGVSKPKIRFIRR